MHNDKDITYNKKSQRNLRSSKSPKSARNTKIVKENESKLSP